MILRKIARPLLASAFVASGAELLRAPAPVVETVQPMVDSGRDALPAPVAGKLPANAATAMRIAGAVQVGGGVLLATGKAPRLAAGVLAATLVPVAVYDSAFWTETDPVRREARKVGLIKNAGLLGGVLIASADTEGKPSAAWRAHHAVDEAEFAAKIAAREAQLAGKVGKRKAKKIARRAAKEALRQHGHPVAALALPIAVKAGTAAVSHLDGKAAEDLHGFNAHAAERAADLAGKGRAQAELAATTIAANAPVVAEKARDRAEELAVKVQNRAPIVAEQARERADVLAEQAREKAPIVAEKAKVGAEHAKDAAEEAGRKVKARWRERRAS